MMETENRKTRDLSVILIIMMIVFSVAFLIGAIMGIIDFQRGQLTYQDLTYCEYTFRDFNFVESADPPYAIKVRVEEEGNALYIPELVADQAVDGLRGLEVGDRLYCYVYEEASGIKVVEMKAGESILSLDAYNKAYQGNGMGLMIVMSILSLACVAYALTLFFERRRKI